MSLPFMLAQAAGTVFSHLFILNILLFQVAAITNSTEYKLGLRRNAKLDTGWEKLKVKGGNVCYQEMRLMRLIYQ